MTAVFAVQNDTGTVALLTIQDHTAQPIAVGDTGTYSGLAFDGSVDGTAVELPFIVSDVPGPNQFAVMTFNTSLSDWPLGGTITWSTGANVTGTSTVIDMDGANAYIDPNFLDKYASSRGNFIYANSPVEQVQQAIVQATDYIDQRYRFKGVKLIQAIGNTSILNLDIGFIMPWMTPQIFGQVPYLTPATSSQPTEWPRQGVVDYGGDTINGIPKAIKQACAELALRALNGVVLQPDYDPNVIAGGAVVASYSVEVGPIKETTSYDTKLGLGFFASFPQVDRLLARSGLLVAGGGRTVIR
jgi:hypothetical protein